MSVIANRRLFIGRGNGTAALYQFGSAGTDNGGAIAARWQTRPISPFGVGSEAIFTALLPVISYTGSVTLKFTPIIDGVLYDGTAGNGVNCAVSISLTAPADGKQATYRGDLGLSQPYVVGGVEKGRNALRGTWIQIDVDVTSVIGNDINGNPGIVDVEGIEIETEETLRTTTKTPSPSYP